MFCLPLIFQKQRASTRSVCPCLPTMGFGSIRTKVCSVDIELRRKNVKILVGNVNTADGVSAAWSTWKRVEEYVLKLENLSVGKAVSSHFTSLCFHLALWSHRFSALYIILMHLVMTTHMDFNNQIKKSMPEKRLFKIFLKQYWPYLIIVILVSSLTLSLIFFILIYMEVLHCFQLLFSICIIQYMQSPIILSHQRLFVTPTSPFRCTQWQHHPIYGWHLQCFSEPQYCA